MLREARGDVCEVLKTRRALNEIPLEPTHRRLLVLRRPAFRVEVLGATTIKSRRCRSKLFSETSESAPATALITGSKAGSGTTSGLRRSLRASWPSRRWSSSACPAKASRLEPQPQSCSPGSRSSRTDCYASRKRSPRSSGNIPDEPQATNVCQIFEVHNLIKR